MPQWQYKRENGKSNEGEKNVVRTDKFKREWKGRQQTGNPQTTALCRSGNDSILSITGLLDSNTVTFGLDIGGVESIIARKVVEKFNIQIFPSSIQIKTATNEVRTVDGVTGNLRIEIEGHVCNSSLLVVNIEDHEILLDLDWFRWRRQVQECTH